MKIKNILLILTVIVLVGVGVIFSNKTKTPETNTEVASLTSRYEVILDNLDIPWDFEFLPEGEILITERGGTLKSLKNSVVADTEIENVKHFAEGGLLGVVKHPDFRQNNFIYLYKTIETEAGFKNKVERYQYIDGSLSDKKEIVSNIPGAKYHDGGRLLFSKENHLYIATGDATNPDSAQDINSLAGKILRVDENGAAVEDNPFNNFVYSYGHRNPQGLAFDRNGKLWSTEHGRRGLDEFNKIERGGNYGWPTSQGDKSKEEHIRPIIHSGKNTWAPASLLITRKGRIFFGGLRGEALYEIIIKDEILTLREYFKGVFGRIRSVKEGNDGNIYITTSNRDGRGKVQRGNDKLIKIFANSI